MLSLNKRKRGPSQGTSDHDQTASSHTAGETSLNREERKRLKKIRKDKIKKFSTQSSTVEYMIVANGSSAVTPSSSVDTEKKHKKKHKCYDDLCKHRKHKKRRKHKKHHHREHNEDENDRQMEHLSIVQNTTQQSLSNDSNNNEEDAEEFEEEESLIEENDEVSQDCVSQYEIVKKFEDPPVKEEDTMTSVLTSESSSGSVYVSLNFLLF